ncbi:DNA sulfur modification protein DndE [Marinospirillum insulare]|uniref:DNA sulfur modification protein DndE n=1 Tax=Marinospirillum insulare TaxID=217169 RepID=A0ABQ6A0S7_9GAMM|nr:DNA sulfur modification protein DndE [Marinospirillum insulare]GLR63734.1 hypothetical protein GCM10007878_11690 [Marinospirillum insulare]
MTDTIETIRLSEKQKQQLIRLKAKTGIENWNVLCRWALCLSLAEDSPPPYEDIPSDSNVEMSWKVFAGEFSEVLHALLATYSSMSNDQHGLKSADYLKLHLNRGISIYSKSLC